MKQLQDQLFRATQFVFDNEESFVEKFIIHEKRDIDLVNIFFSGSKVFIKYDLTFYFTLPVECWLVTQEVFDWMEEQGFAL